MKFLKNPTVRLFGRALVAAGLVLATNIHNNSATGVYDWKAIAAGCGLAFVEVFTPLNSVVGIFKTLSA